MNYTLDEENCTITFVSDKYVHAVEVEGNLVLDDNYFSLLPGEERTVSYKKKYENLALDLSVTAYTM